MNEINCMRKLNHENIVKLYEVWESENSLFLVLELLGGGCLQDLAFGLAAHEIK